MNYVTSNQYFSKVINPNSFSINRNNRMKLKFEDKLSVIRVKREYAAPYLKYPYIYLKRADVSSKAKFTKKVEAVCQSWPPGFYYFKNSAGKVVTRFKISNGKVITIYKNSPATGFKYPIWDWMKK